MTATNSMGAECVKAFINKLRSVNTKWSDSLLEELHTKMGLTPDNTVPKHLSLTDLQAVVAKKITEYETLRLSTEAAAPNAPNRAARHTGVSSSVHALSIATADVTRAATTERYRRRS